MALFAGALGFLGAATLAASHAMSEYNGIVLGCAMTGISVAACMPLTYYVIRGYRPKMVTIKK